MTRKNNQTWNYAKDFSRHGDINKYLCRIIGKRFVDYRKKWDAACGLKRNFKFPLFLVIETMFKCNLRCVMCIHSNAGGDNAIFRYGQKMPFELYKRIIREAAGYNCPSLTIGGTSEPLLDPDIIDMVKFAYKSGFVDIMLNTNATLLNDDLSIKLINSGLTRLRVGFDGVSKSSYEKIRIGADFNKVKSNILNFVKRRDLASLKLPVVRLSCVHMKKNQANVNKFIDLWKPIADYVSIQNYRPHEFTIKRFNLDPQAGRGDRRVIKKYICSNPFERLYIRGNGDVYACCNIAYGPKIGNVNSSSLYNIWNSPAAIALREALKRGDWHKIPKCKICLTNSYIY